MTSCLFCPKELGASEGREHLIPEALGGWLTTDDVCRDCNSRFGHTVDSLANDSLFVALKRACGLGSRDGVVRIVADPESGELVQGRIGPGGVFQPLNPVKRGGGQFIIQAATQAASRAIAERMALRRARDEGQEVRIVDLGRAEGGPRWVRAAVGVQDAAEFNYLLAREGAKVAVEYIALRVDRELAQVPELGALKEFAVSGAGAPGVRVVYSGPAPHALLAPINEVLFFGVGLVPPQSQIDETIDQIVPQEADGPPDLSSVPEWPGFEHRLQFVATATGVEFRLTLFSCLHARVELPGSLGPLLPVGTYDSSDMTQGARNAHHAWGRSIPLLARAS